MNILELISSGKTSDLWQMNILEILYHILGLSSVNNSSYC